MELAFLDVKVTRTDMELKTSVHCKATHTERYIPFHSHHHQRTITGVLRCMRDRGNMICGPESREAEMQHLQQVFQANGFPEDLVRKILSHQLLPSNPNLPSSSSPTDEGPAKILRLPYVKGLSEKVERVCATLHTSVLQLTKTFGVETFCILTLLLRVRSKLTTSLLCTCMPL